jgi:hypothetical protein
MAKMWLGLKPEGAIEGLVAPVSALGPVSVRMRPVLPSDEQAMAMIGLQLVNAPKQILSQYTVLKDYIQVDDPEGEMDRIAVEKALMSPPLEQEWVQAALKRSGIAPPPPAPPPGLVGPNGQLLPPSGMGGGPGGPPPGPMSPYPNGQTASGTPSIPGLTMPPIPNPPAQMPHGGGPPAGSYPGQPGGVHGRA